MRIVLFIITLLWSLPLGAQTRAEQLDFDVTWGFNDVATMSIQNGCPKRRYTPAALNTRSRGAAEQLHSFHVRFDTFTDAKGQPIEGRTYIKEEGKARSFATRFAQKSGRTQVTKKIADRESTVKFELRPPTHDMLSWLGALRAEKLVDGAKFEYFVWDGWKLSRVNIVVEKQERVWTPVETYRAFRLAISRTRLHHKGDIAYTPKQSTRHLGHLWLATAAGHLPVAMDFDAPVGKAKIRLKRAVYAACGS